MDIQGFIDGVILNAGEHNQLGVQHLHIKNHKTFLFGSQNVEHILDCLALPLYTTPHAMVLSLASCTDSLFRTSTEHFLRYCDPSQVKKCLPWFCRICIKFYESQKMNGVTPAQVLEYLRVALRIIDDNPKSLDSPLTTLHGLYCIAAHECSDHQAVYALVWHRFRDPSHVPVLKCISVRGARRLFFYAGVSFLWHEHYSDACRMLDAGDLDWFSSVLSEFGRLLMKNKGLGRFKKGGLTNELRLPSGPTAIYGLNAEALAIYKNVIKLFYASLAFDNDGSELMSVINGQFRAQFTADGTDWLVDRLPRQVVRLKLLRLSDTFLNISLSALHDQLGRPIGYDTDRLLCVLREMMIHGEIIGRIDEVAGSVIFAEDTSIESWCSSDKLKESIEVLNVLECEFRQLKAEKTALVAGMAMATTNGKTVPQDDLVQGLCNSDSEEDDDDDDRDGLNELEITDIVTA